MCNNKKFDPSRLHNTDIILVVKKLKLSMYDNYIITYDVIKILIHLIIFDE